MTIDTRMLQRPEVVSRLDRLEDQLVKLFEGSPIRFDGSCRSALPEAPGVYRIFSAQLFDETVRAGRSDVTLRQRVYQNHLMGNQSGNLRSQLVRDGSCADLESAKRHIQAEFLVQVLVVPDQRERVWLEHFILAVLRPRYCV